MTRARHCTWLGSYNSPGLQLICKSVCHLWRHCCAAVVTLLTFADQLGDTSQTHLGVDHEVIRGLSGGDGVVDVHGVEVEWNVATFNVQLDGSSPQPCGKSCGKPAIFEATVLSLRLARLA